MAPNMSEVSTKERPALSILDFPFSVPFLRVRRRLVLRQPFFTFLHLSQLRQFLRQLKQKLICAFALPKVFLL
jgi:hypothetical protein